MAGTRTLTPQQLKVLADQIDRLETRMNAERTARAGRKILDRMYGGDRAEFQSKNQKKAKSLRDLAKLLRRSTGRVWGLVASAIVYEDLPSDLRDRLKPGHLEALHAAVDVERERFAREAVALSLTVPALRARIAGQILPDPVDPKAQDRSPIARAERLVDDLKREAASVPADQKPEHDRRIRALIAELSGLVS